MKPQDIIVHLADLLAETREERNQALTRAAELQSQLDDAKKPPARRRAK